MDDGMMLDLPPHKILMSMDEFEKLKKEIKYYD
jgi:hypothetical protein